MFANIVLLCAIAIGGHRIEVEIADTKDLRAKGLMGRKNLPEDGGMLFIFDEALIGSFWMKNVTFPLSIAFFDAEKKLIEILDMEVDASNNNPQIYQSSKPILYALEVIQNWFSEKNIRPGMKFSFLEDSR